MMSKMYGYAWKMLVVDLTNEIFTDENLDDKTVRKYIGGTGIGAKYLYDGVPAGITWSNAENRIIIASGPLGGTRIPGSGTLSVVTKGPLTNGSSGSQANGFFGAFIRFAGYDGIVLHGKARRWVYLYIHDNKAEIRDASHLTGKDTYETCDIIKSELGLGDHDASVVSIGPAGENLVKFASIFADKGHTASKNGTGAVMGSKKLKAIAVSRKGKAPALKDKEGFFTIANQFRQNATSGPRAATGIFTYGTLNYLTAHIKDANGHVPVKNFNTNIFSISPEELEKFSGPYIRGHFQPRPNPCWACPMHHCHTLTLNEGPYKGNTVEEPEYEGLAAFGPMIGVTDATATIYLADKADRLGMDICEASWTLGLAMECYEKGIIAARDTDGIELNWGNYEAANRMLHNIALREGFGDVLAEGAMRAAQRIGGDALNIAVHTMKGNTPRVIDHRHRWPWLFDTTLGQIGSDEGYVLRNPKDLGLDIHPTMDFPNSSKEDVIEWNIKGKGACQFEDCLGTCRFITGTDIKLISQALSAATGWDFSMQEAMDVGRRIINLLRVFNIRHGHTAEMDAPSPRYGSAPVDGPVQGKSIIPVWGELRCEYYERMGWDKETGKPLPETLKNHGLEFAIPELWGK
jgi:aldehyde:ferredoxin oxidoreductase